MYYNVATNSLKRLKKENQIKINRIKEFKGTDGTK